MDCVNEAKLFAVDISKEYETAPETTDHLKIGVTVFPTDPFTGLESPVEDTACVIEKGMILVRVIVSETPVMVTL